MAFSLRLDKAFTYRGATEKWSNKYHLSGTAPSTTAEWTAICDALVAQEKTLYASGVTVVYAAGYTSDTGAAVFTRDYTVSPDTPVAGTFSPSTAHVLPGDSAAWIRWWAGQYNSRGKKIYLRKYFHGVYVSNSGDQDTLLAGQKTAYGTYGALLVAGLTVTGYASRKLADKDGNVAVSYNVVSYTTTRTLKRRSGSPL